MYAYHGASFSHTPPIRLTNWIDWWRLLLAVCVHVFENLYLLHDCTRHPSSNQTVKFDRSCIIIIQRLFCNSLSNVYTTQARITRFVARVEFQARTESKSRWSWYIYLNQWLLGKSKAMAWCIRRKLYTCRNREAWSMKTASVLSSALHPFDVNFDISHHTMCHVATEGMTWFATASNVQRNSPPQR